jgi:hypothetical protein
LIRHPVHDGCEEEQFVTLAATAGYLMPPEPWFPVPGRVRRRINRQEGNVGGRREVLREYRLGTPMDQDQATVRKRDTSPGVAEDPGKATFVSLTVRRENQTLARKERVRVRSAGVGSFAIHGFAPCR